MSKHTPGPWVRNGSVVRGAGCDRKVADVRISNDEGIANAKLIVAAPNLLTAAQKTVDAWAKLIDSFNYVPGIGDRAEDMEFREILELRAAIATATA